MFDIIPVHPKGFESEVQDLYEIAHIVTPEVFVNKFFPGMKVPAAQLGKKPFQWIQAKTKRKKLSVEVLAENYVNSLNECVPLSSLKFQVKDPKVDIEESIGLEPVIIGVWTEIERFVPKERRWTFRLDNSDTLDICANLINNKEPFPGRPLERHERNLLTAIYNNIIELWSNFPCRHVFIGSFDVKGIRIARASPTGLFITTKINPRDDPSSLFNILHGISNDPGIEYGPNKFFKPVESVSLNETIIESALESYKRLSGKRIRKSGFLSLIDPLHGKEKHLVILDPIGASSGLFERSVRCYLIIPVSFVSRSDIPPVEDILASLKVLKTSWTFVKEREEGEFYQILQSKPAVPFISTVFGYGVVPHSRGNASNSPGIGEEYELRWLIMCDVGVPIERFNKTKEFVGALRDALIALKACKDKKIMHRDISINNIMINLVTRRGLLIDFDRAADLRHLSAMGTGITGTPVFLSIVRFEGIQHRFWHDAESIFWVLLHLTVERAPEVSTTLHGPLRGSTMRRNALEGFYDNLDFLTLQRTRVDCLKKIAISSPNQSLADLINIQVDHWRKLYIHFNDIIALRDQLDSLEKGLGIKRQMLVENPLIPQKDIWSTIKSSSKPRLRSLRVVRRTKQKLSTWTEAQEALFKSVTKTVEVISKMKSVPEPTFDQILLIFETALDSHWPEEDRAFHSTGNKTLERTKSRSLETESSTMVS